MPEDSPAVNALSSGRLSLAKPVKFPPVRLVLGALVVVAITGASLWLALHPDWVLGLGRWGYVGAFLISLIASATIILPAPGIAVVVAMGAALDPFLLGIAAGLGSALGELSGYLAGASGRTLVPASRRAQVERIHTLTDRYGALLLGALAALPFPLFDLAGIVAGVLRMNILSFLVAVSVGKSVKYIFLIVIASGPILFLQHLVSLWSGG